MLKINLIVVVLLATTGFLFAAIQGPRRGKLIWFDEFEENKVDLNKWYFQIGDGSNTTAGPVNIFF